METINFECKFLVPHAKMPVKSRYSDAAYDIHSSVDVILPPRPKTSLFGLMKNSLKQILGMKVEDKYSFTNVPTGIALSCPKGFYYTIDGRSGLGFNLIEPFRGVIDSGYVGQLMILLKNFSDEPYEIKKGDRIAQICVHRVIDVKINLVEDFSEDYVIRGTAGFGSSGR
jgi:deoxyuridine 5'-triphosphate nucleotidohydrolase